MTAAFTAATAPAARDGAVLGAFGGRADTFAGCFAAFTGARWGGAFFAAAFFGTGFLDGAFRGGAFFAAAFLTDAFLGGAFFAAFFAGAFFAGAFLGTGLPPADRFPAAFFGAACFTDFFADFFTTPFFTGPFFAGPFFAGPFFAERLPVLFFAELAGADRLALFPAAFAGALPAGFETVFFTGFLAFLAFAAMLTSQSLLGSTSLRQALRHMGGVAFDQGDDGRAGRTTSVGRSRKTSGGTTLHPDTVRKPYTSAGPARPTARIREIIVLRLEIS